MLEREVVIATPDGAMDCFFCTPEEGGPHPGVILYMDAPGIREELRDMSRRIATVGYAVLMPNMYYRTGTEGNYGFDLTRTAADQDERDKMFAVMNTLTNALVVADTSPDARIPSRRTCCCSRADWLRRLLHERTLCHVGRCRLP